MLRPLHGPTCPYDYRAMRVSTPATGPIDTGPRFYGTADVYVREPGSTVVGFSMRMPGQPAPAPRSDS